ncbi:MAG: GlsB/YeaQ/YmgE family stress response membrane protein, partial [Nitrospirota bacterium]
MSIIGWIVFGLIVGVVAKFLTPGPDPGGWILTILLGIGGALLGGFIGRGLGWYREEDPVGFLMALFGAILILIIRRQLTGPSRS